ncbi:MAG TPA: hypothetical protein VFF59_11170 [Anaerolineae bacterium]|nr:hypothetical protein [Anaerolineae bacterium]
MKTGSLTLAPTDPQGVAQCGVVAEQLPSTAKGFAFLAIEDLTGRLNVMLAPDMYAKYRGVLHGAGVARAAGTRPEDGERLTH